MAVLPVAPIGWWEYRIQCYSEGVFEHTRDQSSKQRRRQLQAGITIDFNKPGLQILVEQVVQPKQFEGIGSLRMIQFSAGRFQSNPGILLHVGKHLLLEVDVPTSVKQIQVSLEFVVGYFVASLELAIFLSFLLDGVVGEMDHLVRQLF